MSTEPDLRIPYLAEISVWKDEVRSFFDEDWSRLRTLIMQLEEVSWTTDPETVGPFAERRNDNHTESNAHDPGPAIRGNCNSTQEDRLSSLVKQIEHRLLSKCESEG